MKFALIAAILATSSVFAAQPLWAKGSSHQSAPGQSVGGMIPWSVAQRVVIFPDSRHWHNTEGMILICPWDAEASYNKICKDKKNDRWIPLTSYVIPGFEIVGIQYLSSGSSLQYQQLTVYFGTVKATVKSITELEGKVAPTLNFSGPFTIQADRVVVQRKR